MEITIKKLASLLNGKIIGNENIKIFQLARIDDCKDGDIGFISNPLGMFKLP